MGQPVWLWLLFPTVYDHQSKFGKIHPKWATWKKKNFASCKDNIQVLYLFGNGIKIGSRWFNSYFDSIQYVWEIAIRRFWPPILLEIASGTWRDLVFKARNDFNAFFRSLCKTTNILSPLLRSENFFQIGATLINLNNIHYNFLGNCY